MKTLWRWKFCEQKQKKRHQDWMNVVFASQSAMLSHPQFFITLYRVLYLQFVHRIFQSETAFRTMSKLAMHCAIALLYSSHFFARFGRSYCAMPCYSLSTIRASSHNGFWNAFERKVSLNFHEHSVKVLHIENYSQLLHHFYQFSRINSICFLNEWKS